MKLLNQRGDTIIEVLIVLAILGFAISISYSSASRSLADSEQSEQNAYATEVGQSQIEQIRGAVTSSLPTLITGPTAGQISNLPSTAQGPGAQEFCMSSGTAVLISGPNCQNTQGGVTYTIADLLTQTAPLNPVAGLPLVNLFQVQVTWPDALGQGTDTVTLFYKVYPPETST